MSGGCSCGRGGVWLGQQQRGRICEGILMLLVLGRRGELPATCCPGLGLNLSGEPVLLDTRRVRTSEDGILHTHTHPHTRHQEWSAGCGVGCKPAARGRARVLPPAPGQADGCAGRAGLVLMRRLREAAWQRRACESFADMDVRGREFQRRRRACAIYLQLLHEGIIIGSDDAADLRHSIDNRDVKS